MIETWLAVAVFGVLALLWIILPSRLIRRENGLAQASAGSAPSGNPADPHGGAIAPAMPPASPNGTSARRSARFGGLRRYTGDVPGEGPVPCFLYVANLSGLNGWGEVSLPIFREAATVPDVRRKETYRAEIAGSVLEAGNLPELHGRLDEAVLRLMHGRLPHLWFELPGGAVPVERPARHYEARVPGGPVITARTLALLRERLTHYTLSVGLLAREDEMTLVTLGPDLRRDPPLAVLAGPEIWAPIFGRNGALHPEGAALPRGNGPFAAPAALLGLTREIGGLLAGREASWTQVRLKDLSAAVWAEISRELRPVSRRLRVQKPDGTAALAGVFSWEDVLLTALGADRLSVYFAPTDWELADRLAADLERAGQIAHRDDVRVERLENREEVTRR